MKGVSVMDSLRINLAREVTDKAPGRLPLSAPSKVLGIEINPREWAR